jgi:hypothetical protein
MDELKRSMEPSESEHRQNWPAVCFISIYPPRACGIATFTSDLRQGIVVANEARSGSVIALTNAVEVRDYPPEVIFEIWQNRLSDYRLAAEYINLSGVNVVSLQHEFGIFGGQEGRYIIELLERLRKPVVTTLPSYHQSKKFFSKC